jgi:hypothetical protein
MSIPSRIVSFTFAFGSHLIKSMEMSAQTWFGISKGWQKEAWERGFVVVSLINITTGHLVSGLIPFEYKIPINCF